MAMQIEMKLTGNDRSSKKDKSTTTTRMRIDGTENWNETDRQRPRLEEGQEHHHHSRENRWQCHIDRVPGCGRNCGVGLRYSRELFDYDNKQD